jgi:hypothetical protein
VSARHQVKRPDRSFEGLASIENRSGRRNGFSSYGADLKVRNFTTVFVRVKSDPDVFADALVPRPVHIVPGALNRQNPKCILSDRRRHWPAP